MVLAGVAKIEPEVSSSRIDKVERRWNDGERERVRGDEEEEKVEEEREVKAFLSSSSGNWKKRLSFSSLSLMSFSLGKRASELPHSFTFVIRNVTKRALSFLCIIVKATKDVSPEYKLRLLASESYWYTVRLFDEVQKSSATKLARVVSKISLQFPFGNDQPLATKRYAMAINETLIKVIAFVCIGTHWFYHWIFTIRIQLDSLP